MKGFDVRHDNMFSASAATCRDAMLWLSMQRDGELDGSGHARLQLHLKGCAHCETAQRELTAIGLGLDALLARTQRPPETAGVTEAQSQTATNQPKDPSRRRWLGWAGAVGAGLTAGLGGGWGGAMLAHNNAPSTPLMHQIAQYQALYTRETVEDSPSTAEQRNRVLQQWLTQVPQARHVHVAPVLHAQGLQLARTQRLGQGATAILQWVYLPTEGMPVALCGLAAPPEAAGRAPDGPWLASGMRGVHWQDRGVLWVLVAPQSRWSDAALTQLQSHITQQLRAQT